MLKGKVMVKDLGRMKFIPNIKILEHKEPKEEDKIKEEEMKKRLTLNEKQVILYGSLEENLNKEKWNCYTTYYSNVRVVREKGETINVLTANILLETRMDGKEYYIFQERSKDIAVGGKLSFVGGHIDEEDNGIIEGAIRELKEEVIGITESNEELYERLKNANKYVTQEQTVNKGNIQFNFMGVYIKFNNKLNGTMKEGGIVLVPKSVIYEYIEKNKDRFTEYSLITINNFLN